jgi:hypothetical protein
VDGRDKPGHDGFGTSPAMTVLSTRDVAGVSLAHQGEGASQQSRTSTWLILIERSAGRSQIKLMYASHHQQPQKHGRNDEDDPFLVVEEPSMRHAIHGQPPSGYHAPPNQTHYHIYCRRRSLNLIRTSTNAKLGITNCSIETIQKSVTWRSASRQRRRSASWCPQRSSLAPARRSSDVKEGPK